MKSLKASINLIKFKIKKTLYVSLSRLSSFVKSHSCCRFISIPACDQSLESQQKYDAGKDSEKKAG